MLSSTIKFLREAARTSGPSGYGRPKKFKTIGKGKKIDPVGVVVERFFSVIGDFKESLVSEEPRRNGYNLKGQWPTGGEALYDWEIDAWAEGKAIVIKIWLNDMQGKVRGIAYRTSLPTSEKLAWKFANWFVDQKNQMKQDRDRRNQQEGITMTSIRKINDQLSEAVQVLSERQKVNPGGGKYGSFDDEAIDKPTRPGAFKFSNKLLSMLKKEVPDTFGSLDKILFTKQKKLIDDIPREDLPKIFGKSDMADAQDVIASKPKQAMNLFLQNIGHTEPKLGKLIRSQPNNIPLYFYAVILRVSGQDMADIIMKKFFAADPDQAWRSSKWVKKDKETRDRLGIGQ